MKRGNRILIDTNAILEAHRVGCWKALCGFFSMETVEWCINLLAYAMAQSNAYLLCSPDKDCMRVGMILDILRRFVSLEKIAENAGCRRLALRGQYTEKWHQSFCGKLKLDQL